MDRVDLLFKKKVFPVLVSLQRGKTVLIFKAVPCCNYTCVCVRVCCGCCLSTSVFMFRTDTTLSDLTPADA